MGKNEDAVKILADFSEFFGPKNSPFEKLLLFCFEAIRLRSQSCFQELFKSFENSLKRDAEVEKLLRKVGNAQLGIADASSFSLFGMLEGMFK